MEGSDEQFREAVIREVGDILRASLERMADEIRDLASVERYVQGMLRRVGSVMVNQWAAWGAQAAERPDGPRCGRPMEVRNRRARRYVGLVGDVEIQRTEYGCRTCGESAVPEDHILDLGPGCLSPEWTRVVTGACAEIPSFERAAAMIGETLGVSLTADTAARATEAIGAVVEQEMQEAMAEGIPSTPEAEPGPLVLMVGMDATKAHAGGQWRDVKVAVVAPLGPEVVTHPETGRETLRLGPRTYGAGIGDADRFYDRAMVLAQRAGWHPTRPLKVVLLGDGGPWIWARADRFRAEGIEVVEILDLYHAREHIWEVAHAVLGTDVRGQQWADTTAQAILTGGAEAALSALTPRGETHCTQVRRAIEYFTTNADRMHYATYLAQALPLGSGVVESACRLVCGLRCKGPGMRWSLSGVQSVLSLRAERLSQPACWAHLWARAPHMRRPRVATLTKGGNHAA